MVFTNYYLNFKPIALLGQILCQLPVENILSNDVNKLTFNMFAFRTLISVLMFSALIFLSLRRETVWHFLMNDIYYYQMGIVYVINLIRIPKFLLFLVKLKKTDRTCQVILNSRSFPTSKKKCVFIIGCFVLTVTVYFLFYFPIIMKSPLGKGTTYLIAQVTACTMHLHLLNFIYFADELADRFKFLTQAWYDLMQKPEESTQRFIPEMWIESFRFLHLELIDCFKLFEGCFEVILSYEIFFATQHCVFNLYLTLFMGKIKYNYVVSSIIVSFVKVFLFVLASRHLFLSVKGLNKGVFDISNQFKSIKIKRQIILYHMQLNLKVVSINVFGHKVSNWSFFSSYSSLIATNIIAFGQLSNEINGYLNQFLEQSSKTLTVGQN